VPFTIVRNYNLPAYVGKETLFFASSYSGNTEETISAIAEAEANGAYIVVITSGGKLAEIAGEKGYPLLMLPSGLQPRHAVLYSLKALLVVTDKLGITSGKADELAAAADFLQQATTAWRPDVATATNQAKQIAEELMGRSVVVYSGPKLFPAAYKWKISFNENAKHIAWTNQYPEFNHNEFIGWTKQPVDKPYAVIDLRSNLEHKRVQKRFVVSEKLLSGMRPAPIVVELQGSTLLEQLLWAIALGDFVTLYLALLNGINPTPVDLIESFKKALSE
jgi:glucose/mannose-6-phosphate isomerase